MDVKCVSICAGFGEGDRFHHVLKANAIPSSNGVARTSTVVLALGALGGWRSRAGGAAFARSSRSEAFLRSMKRDLRTKSALILRIKTRLCSLRVPYVLHWDEPCHRGRRGGREKRAGFQKRSDSKKKDAHLMPVALQTHWTAMRRSRRTRTATQTAMVNCGAGRRHERGDEEKRTESENSRQTQVRTFGASKKGNKSDDDRR